MFTRKLSFTKPTYPKARAMGITKFPYIEFDSNGNETYSEDYKGTWVKREFDSNGNQTYYENYTGYWVKKEYDSMGKKIYSEYSDGIIIRY